MFHSNDAEVISLQENEENSNDFNIDEEEWNSISYKSISFQDLINADENLASMAIRDIETIFDDGTAEKEDDENRW